MCAPVSRLSGEPQLEQQQVEVTCLLRLHAPVDGHLLGHLAAVAYPQASVHLRRGGERFIIQFHIQGIFVGPAPSAARQR